MVIVQLENSQVTEMVNRGDLLEVFSDFPLSSLDVKS